MSTAEEGKRVDMSLFNAAPLPRLSVTGGTMRTRLPSVSATFPKRSLSETRIAKASNVEITSDGLSPFLKDPGKIELAYLKRETGRQPGVKFSGTVGDRDPAANPCALCAGLTINPGIQCAVVNFELH